MDFTPEQLEGGVRTVKSDWKAVVSLLIAALAFSAIVTWGVTGYVLHGADSQIKSNSEKVIALEAKQVLFTSQITSLEKRQDEVLTEIKGVSVKLSGVAESQARMEGVILGSKK